MSTLASQNSSTLGVEMPEVTLPDGQKVQTGTVGALLINIRRYDAFMASLQDSTKDQAEEREALEAKMRAAVPLLQKVGMFDLFTPDEWSGSSPGRTFVGREAKKLGS